MLDDMAALARNMAISKIRSACIDLVSTNQNQQYAFAEGFFVMRHGDDNTQYQYRDQSCT